MTLALGPFLFKDKRYIAHRMGHTPPSLGFKTLTASKNCYHAADLFAAAAPAAFDLVEENVAECVPSRPITVVSFRGTSDPIVPYDGGYSPVVPGMPITFLGAKGTFEKWGSLNQCTGTPTAEDEQGCTTYPDCQGGVEVVLCTKQRGNHEPGNAAVAWPILKLHTLP